MALIDNLSFLKMFKEAELVSFDEDFIEALGALLDDKLSLKLREFINLVKGSDLQSMSDIPFVAQLLENVQLMETKLGPIIDKNTFHIEAQQRDIIRIVFNNNITNIPLNNSLDRTKLLEDVTWLLDNEHLWQSEIKPRTKEAYDYFIYELGNLMKRARALKTVYQVKANVEIENNPFLKEAVKENKAIFYAKEKPRNTGLSAVIRERVEIEKLHHCLVYNKMCDEQRVSLPMRYLIGGVR